MRENQERNKQNKIENEKLKQLELEQEQVETDKLKEQSEHEAKAAAKLIMRDKYDKQLELEKKVMLASWKKGPAY